MKPQMIKLCPKEDSRIYYFVDGTELEIKDVLEFGCSATTHRLLDGEGFLHIIPKDGWYHIKIKATAWSI